MPIHVTRLNLLILMVFRRVFWGVLLTVVGGLSVMAEEDPYLSAISQEAKKVEAEVQPTLSESGETLVPEDDGLSLQAFEEDLKARYMGSYTFYLKLPKRTREEVFLEYRDGASIDEIRKKIMDRFLHQ